MPITSVENTQKLQRSDHDLLIRLESKVDQLGLDIKDVKDGTSRRISDLEAKMNLMEKIRDQYDPVKLVPMILAHEQAIHDFKLTSRVFLIIAGGTGALVSWILSNLDKL